MDTFFSPWAVTFGIVLLETAAGAWLGWWLRGNRAGSGGAEARCDAQHARESLERVRELTERVAANVGEHTTRVQEISDELSAKSSDSLGDTAGDDILTSISHIVEANAKMHQQLAQAESRMKEQAEEIESHVTIARTDALTGIDNRRAFDDDLAQCLNNWHRLQTPFSLLILDVDHFKTFNDTHGHQAGDEVLKGVARQLKDCMRDIDLVSRYGGEEFAVIFPAADLDAAMLAAERSRVAIEGSVFRYQQARLQVTVSQGVAQSLPGETGESLIERADAALYQAKENSRNCSFYHDGQKLLRIAPASDSSQEDDAEQREPDHGTARDSLADVESVPAPKQQDEETPEEALPPRIDDQTGLPNRDALLEDAGRRIAEWQRYDSPLSAISIVVDDFEQRMEEHGEAGRDLILRIMTQFLEAAMRDMDVVARCDEDLFAILLPGTVLDHAVGVAARFRVAVSHCSLQLGGSLLELTVSMGVATAMAGDDAATMFARSEQAARAAAAAGGNATSVHDGEHCERIDVELEAAGLKVAE